MQYKFKLLKIHCAGCALALEQKLNAIVGVTAEISFVTKVLKLEIERENQAEVLTEVKMAINSQPKGQVLVLMGAGDLPEKLGLY